MRVRSARQARPLLRDVGTANAPAGLLALGLWGCGGPTERPQPAARRLFGAPGGPLRRRDRAGRGRSRLREGYSPGLDKVLRERAQVGDAVLRVRVSTVTAKIGRARTRSSISAFSTVEKLAGKYPPPVDFTVQIDKASERTAS